MTEKVSTPKKGKSPRAKKPKTTPSHPKVSEMVNSAIKDLKDRGGSSLQAIKKYIASNYKVDAEKLAPFIRKYLKSSVVSGGLVQTKGKGASGSFRMGGASGAVKKSPKKAKKTAAKPKAAKPASTVKKAAKPKKTPQKSKPKTAAAKKPKPVVKIAAKKTKPAKTAAKKKPAKASPKKKPAAKKAKAKK